MTLEEAQKAIQTLFKPAFLGEEDVVLLEAYNRVLNEDVVSTLDIPPFNRSTVDGYVTDQQLPWTSTAVLRKTLRRSRRL